ncbi:hypothetical protein PE36_08386 [Moritella sp. PE36]|uniref:hypothetical protein n=1 Tax=Moritella sp. PE36 TaxID=58051 RepID=UPI0001568B87|nr:hypothetical protein [Moritella sp. PE36]EDM65063.1 hypothetical protein PE36_08386 [Moritella sp. PE36]
MSSYQIKKEQSMDLRNIVYSAPFNATEKAIQYGVQYDLECGINCNVYHSDKKPDILKVNIQNKEANTEIANLLDFHISNMSMNEPSPA